MVDGEPDTLEVTGEVIPTNEVVYVEVHFRNGKEPQRLRIPLTEPVDAMNDDYADYGKILMHIEESMSMGQDSVIQIPFTPRGSEFSVFAYFPLAALDAIFVEPPVMEAVDGA